MLNILLTTDNNYIQHTAAMTASLLENTKEKIKFYLLYCELIPQNLQKFEKFINSYNNVDSINNIYVEFNNYFHDVPVTYHFSKTAYLRLLAPYLINEKYIIYLDPDMIIFDDIGKIMRDIDLDNNFLYGVEDDYASHKINIELTSNQPYFSSGVMVMNLDFMRQYNFYEKCLNFIKKFYNFIKFLDQDILNGVLKDKWKPLNPKWNVYNRMIYNKDNYIKNSICYSKEEIENAVTNPSIIHFSGGIKPWHYVDKHPYKKYYWNYLRKTPWKNYKPNDFCFSNFLKKHLNIPIGLPKIRKHIIKFWQRFLAKKKFIRLNRLLYELGLHGIGIHNFDAVMIKTGEKHFIKNYFKNNDSGIVLDVGAYIGSYSKLILNITKSVKIYAFEPNPKNFDKLLKNINDKRFKAYNLAVGNYDGEIKLYDKNKVGSDNTCFNEKIIVDVYNAVPVEIKTEIIKLDSFTIKNNINYIELLKVDVEGYELEVLKGASNLINEKRIKAIQFEFNSMNIYSRVFFKDFYDLLNRNYNMYRLLPDGLVQINMYNPIYCEIFAYQNIAAFLK